MRALRWHGRRDIRLDEVPVPPALAAADVLLRVRAAGICGTDVEEWLDGPVSVRVPEGAEAVTLGHEILAEVVDTGADVSTLAPGDRVVVEVNLTCGVCTACLRGRTNICPHTVALGLQGDGGFAEFVVAPASACVAVSGSAGDRDAVLAEPLAVAVHAVDLVDVPDDARALVVGGGTIGQLLLRALAARRVPAALLEPDPFRRTIAEDAGFTAFASVADLSASTDDGFDVVFEAAGRAEAVGSAVAATARGGMVMVLGVSAAPISIDTWRLVGRELGIRSSLSHTVDDVRTAVAMIESGTVVVSDLLTHTVPLSEAPRAFRLLASRTEQVLKCVIVPDPQVAEQPTPEDA